MTEFQKIQNFLSHYSEAVSGNALKLRRLLLENFPDIQEQLDIPARMVAYCYGQKYSELICTIIPSKTGLKLGFNRCVDLPDPKHLLKGSGKISRYVEIKEPGDMHTSALKELLADALIAFKKRNAGQTISPAE